MNFKLYNTNYYNEKEKLWEANKISLEPNNVYAFTGCNGIGKSTLFYQIAKDTPNCVCKKAFNLMNEYSGYNSFVSFFSDEEKKKKEDYDVYYLGVDKNTRGMDGCTSDAMFRDLVSTMKSTGERLVYNLIPCLQIVDKELDTLKGKTLYLFLDDLDVGTSLDVILEEKQVIKDFAKKLEANNTTYIICIAANNYELAKDFKCIDCVTMKEKKFNSYDDYLAYVIETRKYKDKRP